MAAIRTLDCRLIALLAALSALCSAPLAGGTSKAEQTQHTSSSDRRRDMITNSSPQPVPLGVGLP